MTALKQMKRNDLLDAARPRAASASAEANVGTDIAVRPGAAPAAPEAPVGTTDKKPSLSTHQLKLMKKIIRRGPSHPQYKLATRLLDHQISKGELA
jgi:hypothetical protein